MKSFNFHLVFIAILVVLSWLHVGNDTIWFGVFSALLMFFLGLIQLVISVIYIFKREDRYWIFLGHLGVSSMLIIILLWNNYIDIDDFANFSEHAFLLRVAPIMIGSLFLWGIFLKEKGR
jgi:hypothetical protein